MNYPDIDTTKTYSDGRVSFVKHQGKTILFIDWSNLDGNKMIEFMIRQRELAIMEKFPDNSVLALQNYSNVKINSKVMAMQKEIGLQNENKVKKAAAYGLTRLQLVFVNSLTKIIKVNVKVFNTKEEALDWLVEDGS